MYLEGKNYIVRNLKPEDKHNIMTLEESRPWAKNMLKFANFLPSGNTQNYFEDLWKDYVTEQFFWCIYRKDGSFCGDIQLDKDGEEEFHFYIQLMDDAEIEGFGTELFGQLLTEVAKISRAKYLYIELWNEEDRSKLIYEEAGYEIKNGQLEIDI